MKFLIDGSLDRLSKRQEAWPEGFLGQLRTPLTNYADRGYPFAIDNGAYSNFDEQKFFSLLKRALPFRDRCLFVALPDVVGNKDETRRLFQFYKNALKGWPTAYVLQDDEGSFPTCRALFVGGTNKYKESELAQKTIRKGLEKGLHAHIGRVNNFSRFSLWRDVGAHTCDGSGVSRYDHMWETLRNHYNA